MNILLNSRNSIIKSKTFCHNRNQFGIGYLDKLYQYSKKQKSPFFKVYSHNIRIIEDPLDFYLSLKKGIQSSTFRIGLSCLYLGTGTLQRYLLRQLKKRQQIFKGIDITMVFDYNRSLRQEKGQSSVQMLHNWKQSLNNPNLTVAFNKNSGNLGVLGQIIGVHHQKMAIFDDKIIIGGANMSQSYFLNRKDRYMEFNQCEQMGSYLFQYLKTLAQNSYHIESWNKLKKKNDNLDQHLKLWSIAFRPSSFKQNIHQQEQYMDQTQRQIQIEQARNIQIKQVKRKETQLINRNEQIAKQIGTSIKVRQQIDEIRYQQRLESVRQNLYGVGRQEFVGNELQCVQNTYFNSDALTQRGQKVYVFPFMHYPKLKITEEPKLFNQILQTANQNNNNIKISSGYLNLTEKILSILSRTETSYKGEKKAVKNEVQILCSAPQANSFYEGGLFKKYIPFFYRCFEIQIFKKFNPGNKISIFQFNRNNQWTFHSKGVWIKQSENSYLTIVGSSNYNWRSEKGDTQLQMYVYSTCPKFNTRLEKQYQHMKEDCHQVDLQKVQNDQQIKCSSWIKFMSKIFKRFL